MSPEPGPGPALSQAPPRAQTKALALLEANPHHPSLRLHALTGRMAGLHSVSINLSYLITLELMIEDQRMMPINVGDHDSVC